MAENDRELTQAERRERAEWKNFDTTKVVEQITNINNDLRMVQECLTKVRNVAEGYDDFEKAYVSLYQKIGPYADLSLFVTENASVFNGDYSESKEVPVEYAALEVRDQYKKAWKCWTEVKALSPVFEKMATLTDELLIWFYDTYQIFGGLYVITQAVDNNAFRDLNNAMKGIIALLNEDIPAMSARATNSKEYVNKLGKLPPKYDTEYRTKRQMDYMKEIDAKNFKYSMEITEANGVRFPIITYQWFDFIDKRIAEMLNLKIEEKADKVKGAIEICSEMEKLAEAAMAQASENSRNVLSNFIATSKVYTECFEHISKVIEAYKSKSNEFPYCFFNPLPEVEAGSLSYELLSLKKGGLRNGGSSFCDIMDIAAVALYQQYVTFMNFEVETIPE